MRGDRPHLPRRAPIDAYGDGKFRFAGMSHAGSLLCLPSGIWAWDPVTAAEIDAASLQPVLDEADEIDMLILGAGRTPWIMPRVLRALLQERRISTDVLVTGSAVRTYNIVLAEGRRAAAALIAVA
jgi:uncharacterized protein